MALGATIYHLQIELSDVDRGVYESLDLRVARHPSESMRYLLTRVLAYCLLFEEGIAFSKGGLSDNDQAAISVRDLQGNLRVLIEVGNPSADRLHKASKLGPRLVVFTHHDARALQEAARARGVFNAESIEVFSLDVGFLDALDAATDRNTTWALTHTEGQLYVSVAGNTLTGSVTRHAWSDA